MADLLVYYKTHWFDLATPERQAQVDIDRKFDCRYQLGDIIEIQESGFFQKWENPKFRYITVSDRTKAQILHFMKSWKRSFTTARTLNDTVNGRYEYTLTINQTSISGKELLQTAREIITKPDWIEIIEKTATGIKIGFNGAILRRDLFEENAKDILWKMERVIAKRRYSINIAGLPLAVRNKLNSTEPLNWHLTYTSAQILPYIIDKTVA